MITETASLANDVNCLARDWKLESAHGAPAVRSVYPNKAFPIFGRDETLEQALCTEPLLVSDNPSSRFSCYRFNVAFVFAIDACHFSDADRLVAFFSDLVRIPGCLLQIVISQGFGILQAGSLVLASSRARILDANSDNSLTATCIKPKNRSHGLSNRARVLRSLSPSHRAHMHSTSTIVGAASPLKS